MTRPSTPPEGLDVKDLAHSPSAHTQPGTVKTVADILTAAANLIEPEGAWTQGAFARDEAGRPSLIRSPDAVCFCAAGAVDRAAHHNHYAVSRALDALQETACCSHNIGEWNDAPERTQAEVVAALRAAAEKARTAAESPSVGTDERSEVVNPKGPHP